MTAEEYIKLSTRGEVYFDPAPSRTRSIAKHVVNEASALCLPGHLWVEAIGPRGKRSTINVKKYKHGDWQRTHFKYRVRVFDSPIDETHMRVPEAEPIPEWAPITLV